MIAAFPQMMEMHQNGMVIFIHCRSGHSRGPAFRKGWFFVGGASSFFGFDKRGGGVGRRVSTWVCPEVSVERIFHLGRLGRKDFSPHPRQGIINMTLQPTRIALNRVWADRFARPLWTGTFSSTCLAGKPWIGSPGRRANFEHFELGRGSINFKVFKVASTDQARHPNFEHFEFGRASINFNVSKWQAPVHTATPTLKTLKLVGEHPV